jgi:hypothetical protein
VSRPDERPRGAPRAPETVAAVEPPGTAITFGPRDAPTRPVAVGRPAPRSRTLAGDGADLGRRALRTARKNRAFTAVLAVGVVLRMLAVLAYRPVLEFYGDSYSYLLDARTFRPSWIRPFGYPLALRALSSWPTIGIVPVVQHLAGLAMGVVLYALLVHRGVARPLAAAGAAPVLLDAYQVQIEQMVMAETLFSALVVGAVALLCWSSRPTPRASAVAGLLLVLATLTRTTASALAVLAVGYLLARGVGWRGVRAFATAFAIPSVGYVIWFHGVYGAWSTQRIDGAFLWGRVAPFADCRVDHLPASEAALCSPHPPADRPGSNFYDWAGTSPAFQLLRSHPATGNTRLRAAARRVILAQPGDYARAVARDTLHYFEPGRHTGPRDWYVGSWIFPTSDPPPEWHVDHPLVTFGGQWVPRAYAPVLGGWLRGYQRFGYTPGPLLALCAATALAAAARRGTGRRGTGRRRRQECLLLVASGLALLIVPSATAVFDYRYLLPVLLLLPPAAALGVDTAVRGRARAGGRAPASRGRHQRRPGHPAEIAAATHPLA